MEINLGLDLARACSSALCGGGGCRGAQGRGEGATDHHSFQKRETHKGQGQSHSKGPSLPSHNPLPTAPSSRTHYSLTAAVKPPLSVMFRSQGGDSVAIVGQSSFRVSHTAVQSGLLSRSDNSKTSAERLRGRLEPGVRGGEEVDGTRSDVRYAKDVASCQGTASRRSLCIPPRPSHACLALLDHRNHRSAELLGEQRQDCRRVRLSAPTRSGARPSYLALGLFGSSEESATLGHGAWARRGGAPIHVVVAFRHRAP